MGKFDLLEKKLSIASSLIDELEIEDCDIVLPTLSPAIALSADLIEIGSCEIFSVETLKSDFMLIRQNLMKLIATGQRVLDSASLIDISDMDAKRLNALSSLMVTIGGNSELLVSIYKQIVDIERGRDKPKGGKGSIPEGSAVINQGNITNNNIVFTGGSDELLEIIKQNQNT